MACGDVLFRMDSVGLTPKDNQIDDDRIAEFRLGEHAGQQPD